MRRLFAKVKTVTNAEELFRPADKLQDVILHGPNCAVITCMRLLKQDIEM